MSSPVSFNPPIKSEISVDLKAKAEENAKIAEREKSLSMFDINELDDEQLEARVAMVLERGQTLMALASVECPDDMYYEWVPNDDQEIYRMKQLGFGFNEKVKPIIGVHKTAEGHYACADTVLMSVDRRIKDAIDRVEKKRYDDRHKKKSLLEDRIARARGERDLSKGVSIIEESGAGTESIDLEGIDTAVKSYIEEKTSPSPGEELLTQEEE